MIINIALASKSERLTTNGVLKELEKLGKILARAADPSTYSFENRHRAEGYKKDLIILRKAYSAIKRGSDPIEILSRPNVCNGIERNRINLIIKAIHGFESNMSWIVKDDQIEFKR